MNQTTNPQATERTQTIAGQMRQAMNRHPHLTGVADALAVGHIEAVLDDTHLSDAEKLAEIADAVAAVRLADEQRRAELKATAAECRR